MNTPDVIAICLLVLGWSFNAAAMGQERPPISGAVVLGSFLLNALLVWLIVIG